VRRVNQSQKSRTDTSAVSAEIKEMQTLLEQAQLQNQQSAHISAASAARLLRSRKRQAGIGATLTGSLLGLLMMFLNSGFVYQTLTTSLDSFTSSAKAIEEEDRSTAAELAKEQEALRTMRQVLELHEQKATLLLRKIRSQEPIRDQRVAHRALSATQSTRPERPENQRAKEAEEIPPVPGPARESVIQDDDFARLTEALSVEKVTMAAKEAELGMLKEKAEEQIKQSMQGQENAQNAKADAETKSIWQIIRGVLDWLKFWES